MIDDEIAGLSAAELAAAYRTRSLSPVEVARHLLERVDRFEPQARAFAWVDAETTLAMARQSEQRWLADIPIGPGDGIPTTVKDLMDVNGWPTLRGSHASDPGVLAEADSPCVARLREAGAVFLGKTTVPEYGWKALNDSPLHGATANPYDPTRTAGGSSGGAAVAAVLGLGAWHTASDAAGSIRVPAAFCGIFGFKATYGVVPLFPPSAFSGLGHHGPVARNVRDAAAMLTIMSGADLRDATAAPPSEIDFAKSLNEGIEGMRIGYVRSFPDFEIDPEITARLDAAVAVLTELGAKVEEAPLDLSGARDVIEILWAVGCATLVEGIAENKRHLLDPGLLTYAAAGRGMNATTYRAALIGREKIASRLNLLARHHDLLALAVVPIEPFLLGRDTPDARMKSWLDWTPLTYPFNLSHQPAASVPCGTTLGGLPTALQLVGRRFADTAVLRAAHAYEMAARTDISSPS